MLGLDYLRLKCFKRRNGRQPLASPSDLCPPAFTLCVINPLPLSVGQTRDWFLKNRIRWSDSFFLPFLARSLWQKPVSVSWRALQTGPCGKEMKEASGQQPASSHPMFKAAKSNVSESGSGASASWASSWLMARPTPCLSAPRCPEPKDLPKLVPGFLIPRNCEIINVVLSHQSLE